jgi:DNA-nicking Smr family endonuclease|tara:strand:+ start:1246 stop:1782 length:537 start_codon:yes stop_codon:yes gene_type:complete
MDKDDLISFKHQMNDVKPLQANRVYLRKQKGKILGMDARRISAQKAASISAHGLEPEESIDQVKPRDILSYKQKGLDERVFKKLCQGKLPIDSKLDLHHMNVMQARLQLSTFISECVLNRMRVAIVIHGHGEGRERPALLKSYANYWLKKIDLVLAFHSAQLKHGGVGATYLLLAKSR